MSHNRLVSPYMHWLDLAEILEPGDLVEFKRGANSSSYGGALYKHWAVYIGINSNGEHIVIHFSNEDRDGIVAQSLGDFMEIAGDAKVKVDKLWRAANGCACRKNNSGDEEDTPYSPLQIVQRAKAKLGEGGYNLVTNNCEHFANFCRYGKKRSGQVTETTNAALTAVATVAIAGGVALGISYLMGLFDDVDETPEARRVRERNEERARNRELHQ